MLHYALGDRLVRALTLASRPFFEPPPEGSAKVPLGQRMPVLVLAREDERAALDALEADIAPFAQLERLDARGVAELCPLLKAGDGGRRTALPTATASGSTRMRFCRAICAGCAAPAASCTAAHVSRGSSAGRGMWQVDNGPRRSLFGADPGQCRRLLGRYDRRASPACGRSAFSRSGGRSSPSMRRRAPTWMRCPSPRRSATSSISRPRAGACLLRRWTRCRANRCDAQPDEYEVALAALRMEERTIVKVERDP